MQNFKTRFINALREIDWYLAVGFDAVMAFTQKQLPLVKADLRKIADFLNQDIEIDIPSTSLSALPDLPKIPALATPKLASWRKIQFNPIQFKQLANKRNLYAGALILLFALIAASSPTGRYEEPPNQPINHIYAKFLNDANDFAKSLNPIGTADAALPTQNDMNDDVATDKESLSGEANNYGEQSLALKAEQKTIKLARGESFNNALISAGVDKKQAGAITSALKTILNPKTIDIGEEITIVFSDQPVQPDKPKGKAKDAKQTVADNSIRAIDQVTFTPTHDQRIMISRTGNKFKAKSESRPVEVRMNVITATINNSLSEAAKKAGIPQSVLSDMIRVFSYDVDFQREVHSGDKFEVAFEEIYDEEGRFVKPGNMVFANLKYGSKELKIFRYKPQDDTRADYFTAEGKSVRKALLRTPVDGARITRGFGMRRHPILGYSKMHEGVDFGAGMGTPVLAAGDGVVKQKGWNGGYGHYIEIQHNREYATAYGHLSRYAKTLNVGGRVHQGDVIGYVGSTGLSTGPHLHYEVHRGVRKINPLGVKFATGRELAGKELQKFKLALADTQQKIATLKDGKKGAKIAWR
ncbi:MAG: hypothetical protein EYC62_03845 [Alphaproteobacteria bacterium]|nr:MAG: hypothetical protein EYC62_03845 [Alphaproteobacteria bacterium]